MDNNIFTIKLSDSDEESVEVKVRKPTDKDETAANIYSSQIFAKLSRQKDDEGNPAFLLRSQLDKYLEEVGIYTEDDIIELNDMGQEIARLEEKLFVGGITKTEGKETAIRLRQVRNKLMRTFSKKMTYDANTIEHHCEQARFNFLLTRCIIFMNGEPVFKTVEDYETDTTIKDKLIKAIEKVAALVSDYDDSVQSNLPENKFLLKYGFCDESLDLIDPKEKYKVNIYGQRINESGQAIDDNGNLIDNEGNTLSAEIGEFTDEEDTSVVPQIKKKARKKKVSNKVNNTIDNEITV